VARPATVCALASAVWSDAGRVEVHGAWWTVAVYQFQLSLGADNNNADRDRDRERGAADAQKLLMSGQKANTHCVGSAPLRRSSLIVTHLFAIHVHVHLSCTVACILSAAAKLHDINH